MYILYSLRLDYIFLHVKLKLLICFKIKSESSSYRFLSPDCRTISDLFITKTTGIPILVLSKPSLRGSSSFRLFVSSEI